ncbi:Na(+)/H(+) antiporter subunit B [Nocardioides sp. DS6]|uniref:Na(+)/H(+) antiporter subunit B n=1 Tax=Nocardioides eburneus TaxID=3231482 RepID=A0ABV3T4Y1_9ACTN
MSDWTLGLLLVLTAVTATAVVLTRNPGRQAMVLSAYGLMLAMTMVALSAPDVALSQIGVGTAAVPLIVVLAIARCERHTQREAPRGTHRPEDDARDGDRGRSAPDDGGRGR